MENPILVTGIKSRAARDMLILLLFGIYLVFWVFKGQFDIFSIAFIAYFCLHFIILVIRQNVYKLLPDHIRVLSVLGYEKETISLKDRISWKESHGFYRGITFSKLHLYTSIGVYTFSNYSIPKRDYQLLKEYITKGITARGKREHIFNFMQSFKKWVMIGCAVLVLSALALKLYYGVFNYLEDGIYTTIDTKITDSCKISYSRGAEHYTLYIYVDANPRRISLDDFSLNPYVARNFKDSVLPGDSVQLKMVKANPNNRLERIFSGGTDYVYSLKAHGQYYYDVNNYKKLKLRAELVDILLCLVVGVFSVIFIGRVVKGVTHSLR